MKTGEVMKQQDQPPSSVETAKQELVEACKAMLPLVYHHYAGTNDGDIIIRKAERAVARAEDTALDLSAKNKTSIKTAHFGKIGKHYDFICEITGIHDWGHGFYLEGQDRSGHKILFRAAGQEDRIELETGVTVYLRGRILAHDKLFGEAVTIIEADRPATRI